MPRIAADRPRNPNALFGLHSPQVIGMDRFMQICKWYNNGLSVIDITRKVRALSDWKIKSLDRNGKYIEGIFQGDIYSILILGVKLCLIKSELVQNFQNEAPTVEVNPELPPEVKDQKTTEETIIAPAKKKKPKNFTNLPLECVYNIYSLYVSGFSASQIIAFAAEFPCLAGFKESDYGPKIRTLVTDIASKRRLEFDQDNRPYRRRPGDWSRAAGPAVREQCSDISSDDGGIESAEARGRRVEWGQRKEVFDGGVDGGSQKDDRVSEATPIIDYLENKCPDVYRAGRSGRENKGEAVQSNTVSSSIHNATQHPEITAIHSDEQHDRERCGGNAESNVPTVSSSDIGSGVGPDDQIIRREQGTTLDSDTRAAIRRGIAQPQLEVSYTVDFQTHLFDELLEHNGYIKARKYLFLYPLPQEELTNEMRFDLHCIMSHLMSVQDAKAVNIYRENLKIVSNNRSLARVGRFRFNGTQYPGFRSTEIFDPIIYLDNLAEYDTSRDESYNSIIKANVDITAVKKTEAASVKITTQKALKGVEKLFQEMLDRSNGDSNTVDEKVEYTQPTREELKLNTSTSTVDEAARDLAYTVEGHVKQRRRRSLADVLNPPVLNPKPNANTPDPDKAETASVMDILGELD